MRLFIAVFAALATATSINALYLQEAPRHIAGVRTVTQPEPVKVATVEPSAAVVETASTPNPPTASITETPKAASAENLAPSDAQPQQPATAVVHQPIAPPAPRVPPAVPEVLPPPVPLVKSIQRELTARGYAAARNDGVLSHDTRAAIIAYEFDENMPVTGEASESVLKALIFAKASGTPSKAKGASAGRFEQRGDIVGAVQQTLVKYGYISGPADGQLDDRTRDGIRKFEEERGMKQPSGHLTERLLLEMVIVTGRPLAANS